MRASTLTLAFFLVALGSGVSAWAQGPSSIPPPSADRSFEVQLFHPAVGPKSYITLDSADVPGHLLFNLGLLTNYQYGAFALDSTVNDTTTRLDVVRHQAMAELYGAVGLFNLFEVGVAAPMTLYLSGDNFDSAGQGTGSQIHTYGKFGDLRVGAKAAPLAFGPDQAFVFGLSVGATFATGGSANFLGDRSVTGRGRALLEYQSSERFRTVVMLGVLLREKSQILGAAMGDQMLYGAAVDFRVLPDMSVLAEINGRVGSWTYVDANPAELDLAMRAQLPAMFSLLLGVGMGVNHGIGSPMVRGFLGLGWAPDFRDRDHDGIIDILDRCPDEPEDKDGFQDDDGCPDEDNDNDGIPDALDKYPNEPEDFDGFQDEDGCPDPDNDHDGIPDVDDACPNDPEDGKGKRPYDGCPSTLEDSDGDGIPDVKDQCPDEPEDKDGFQDEDGCPDPDNDGDGIPDDKDKCPNEPETVNGYQDSDGCPDEIPAAVKKFTGVIQGINFKTDSAVITKDSHSVLDKTVQVLVDYPDVRLEIGGHTDNVGKAEHNMELSQKRAESVKEYLVGKGISSDRLTAVGYGMDKPLTANKTKADKAKNRRTEFTLIGSK